MSSSQGLKLSATCPAEKRGKIGSPKLYVAAKGVLDGMIATIDESASGHDTLRQAWRRVVEDDKIDRLPHSPSELARQLQARFEAIVRRCVHLPIEQHANVDVTVAVDPVLRRTSEHVNGDNSRK